MKSGQRQPPRRPVVGTFWRHAVMIVGRLVMSENTIGGTAALDHLGRLILLVSARTSLNGTRQTIRRCGPRGGAATCRWFARALVRADLHRSPPCCPVRRRSVGSCGHAAMIEHGARHPAMTNRSLRERPFLIARNRACRRTTNATRHRVVPQCPPRGTTLQ